MPRARLTPHRSFSGDTHVLLPRTLEISVLGVCPSRLPVFVPHATARQTRPHPAQPQSVFRPTWIEARARATHKSRHRHLRSLCGAYTTLWRTSSRPNCPLRYTRTHGHARTYGFHGRMPRTTSHLQSRARPFAHAPHTAPVSRNEYTYTHTAHTRAYTHSRTQEQVVLRMPSERRLRNVSTPTFAHLSNQLWQPSSATNSRLLGSSLAVFPFIRLPL